MKDSEILEILNRLKTQNDKRLSELVMNLINETQLLKLEAYQDNLTKVYNRKILLENPQYDVLVMCDLDNFKEINDKHGHNMGDQVLKDVSSELKLMIRLIKPKYMLPFHGEYRMLKNHADISTMCGVAKENTFILKKRLRKENFSRSFSSYTHNFF